MQSNLNIPQENEQVHLSEQMNPQEQANASKSSKQNSNSSHILTNEEVQKCQNKEISFQKNPSDQEIHSSSMKDSCKNGIKSCNDMSIDKEEQKRSSSWIDFIKKNTSEKVDEDQAFFSGILQSIESSKSEDQSQQDYNQQSIQRGSFINPSIMLSNLSKQKKKETKNWMQGKNIGIRKFSDSQYFISSSEQISPPKSLISGDIDCEQEEIEQIANTSETSLDQTKKESITCFAENQNEKKRKVIKINHSISNKNKQFDFMDDEPIEVDQFDFLGINKNYDITKNIQLSINTILPKQADLILNQKVTIPILISIKTADQSISFTSLRDEEQEISTSGENQLQSVNDVHNFFEEKQKNLFDLFNRNEDKQLQYSNKKNKDSIEKRDQSEEIEKDTIQKNEEGQEENIKNEKLITSLNLSGVKENNNSINEEVNIHFKLQSNSQKNEDEKQIQSNSIKKSKEGETYQPIVKSTRASQRFPIDLICVIDTSGSMDGEPLALVKETLLFLVDLLQKGDRICLVQFSTNAKRLTPLQSITKMENRQIMREEIEKLTAKGGTNINQGMSVAFEVLKQRKYKNSISSVFLLSDGLSDGAEQRIKEILKSMNFFQNYNETSFTIQTFGFGNDHDPNMMDKIAQLMDGNFYYIKDLHKVDECFIDALGGLFSVISQNVDIKIRIPQIFQNKVKIIKTFGDIWVQQQQYYSYSININQLLSGVSKDFVLELEIDYYIIEQQNLQQASNNDPNEILEVELTASSIRINKESQETAPLSTQITELLNENQLSVRQSQNEDQTVQFLIKKECLNLDQISSANESEVNLNYLRVQGAEALEKCLVFALQKKFDEGSKCISNLLSVLQKQNLETITQLSKLIIDLTETEEALKKKVSEQIGWHKMISCKRMHMEQRSSGIDLTYQNSIQKLLIQKRKIIKDQGALIFENIPRHPPLNEERGSE